MGIKINILLRKGIKHRKRNKKSSEQEKTRLIPYTYSRVSFITPSEVVVNNRLPVEPVKENKI